MNLYNKQPSEQLDYDVDFVEWLPDGDTITTVKAFLNVTGELIIERIQYSGQVVKIWLAGGNDGSTYKITVIASTSGGRIKEIEFRLRVKDL